SDLVEVDEDLNPPVAESNALGILTCVETTVLVSGQGSSTGLDISYNWSTSNGNIVAGANSLEPTVNEPGSYTLLVLNEVNGCEATATTTVTEDVENPVADAGADDTLTCAITTLILQGQVSGANPLLNILWTTDDGNIIIGGTELNPLVDAPGLYQLQVTDLINGCTDFDAVLIGQNTIPPNLLILNPGLLRCLEDVVQIDATLSSNGPNYIPSWSTVNGNILSGAASLEVTVDEPGTYTLALEDNDNGCTASAVVEVLEDVEPPIVDAGTGFVFPCAESSAGLSGSATAGTNNLQINWQTLDGQLESNINTLEPEVSGGGTYTLIVTNLDNGCTAQDSVEITADFPAIPAVTMMQPPCAEDLGSLEILSASGGTPPYLYSIDNGMNFFMSPIFAGLSEGIYSVLVQDALGCESEVVSSFIDAPDPLVVNVEAQVEILQGEQIQLDVQLNVLEDEVQQIIWTPTEGLSCSDCLDPIASPLETTVYRVEVILEGDCRSADEVQVVVDERPDVYVPNIFSPNGDGQNDVFLIFARNGSVREIRQFLVFSRWGEVVYTYTHFQPNDPAYGWDGRFKDKAMDPAVFTWFAEVEMLDGRIELFKGDVTLVR
ncbi:MAG: gliding motility-associated C-terminal domain-containing protein, partial [Phaeodactylibacter sp.]|nr:gliding motility-associated C-terminal domain-containing protein [Phaeodactylibacter sp.]